MSLCTQNCSELVFLMRLLSLSLLSWEILDSESKQEPKMVIIR